MSRVARYAAIHSNQLHNFYRRCPLSIYDLNTSVLLNYSTYLYDIALYIHDLELPAFAILSAELGHVAISQHIRCELDDLFDLI